MQYKIKDGRKVAEKGHVIIETVRHYVQNGFVHCNASLNSRAWGVTEHKEECKICSAYVESKHKQLTLF